MPTRTKVSPINSRSTSAPSPAKANSFGFAPLIRGVARSAGGFLVFVLASCASVDGRGLVAGQSSERDVLAVMGTPAEKDAAGAETVYWYPQFPWGHASYAARIGADGRLLAFEQRLTEDNISKIVRGQT